MHHMRKDKERFTARLQRRIEPSGDCLLYGGGKLRGSGGYPNIAYRFKGKMIVMKVHRLFMILKHRAPLPMGYDVGHTLECTSRACVKHIELELRIMNGFTDPQGSHLPAPSGSRQS